MLAFSDANAMGIEGAKLLAGYAGSNFKLHSNRLLRRSISTSFYACLHFDKSALLTLPRLAKWKSASCYPDDT